MSKAPKGIFAEAAIVETSESAIAHQFSLTRGLAGTASLISPLVSVLAASEDDTAVIGSSGLSSASSAEPAVDSSLELEIGAKAVPFGLPDIADEKILQMMAQDSVNGRLGRLYEGEAGALN